MKRAVLIFLVGCRGVVAAHATVPPQDSGQVLAGDQAAAVLTDIRTLEDHRVSGSARLMGYMRSGDPSVALPALLAAGRIADPAYVPAIAPLLSSPVATVRARAAYALELIASPSAVPALQARLATHPSNEIELGALLAANAALAPETMQAPSEALLFSDSRPIVQTNAAGAWAAALATADKSLPPNAAVLADLLRGAATSDRQAVACAGALSTAARTWVPLSTYVPTTALASALSATASDTAADTLLYTLRRFPRAEAEPLIRAALSDVKRSAIVRGTALSSLDAIGWTTPADYITMLAEPDAQLRVVALDLLLASPAEKVTPTLTAVSALATSDRSDWARGEALKLWALFDPDHARATVTADINGSLTIQQAAIASLGEMASPADVQTLLTLAQATDANLYEAATAALSAVPAAAIPASAHGVFAGILANARAYKTIGVLGATVLVAYNMGWTDLAAQFVALYPYFASSAVSEGLGMLDRYYVLEAIQYLADAGDVALAQNALSDREHFVGMQAAAAVQALTGADVSAQVPLNSRVTQRTPNAYEIGQAINATVVLQMARGDITVRLLADAPVGSAKFLAYVSSGFYDGLTFHRVVPAFVAQGGDPSNTGFGTADNLLRDEISAHGHTRGTLGWATDGRDTATSEFFINLCDNAFLDANYTVFGEVVTGMELADDIEQGEPIVHAYVKSLGH